MSSEEYCLKSDFNDFTKANAKKDFEFLKNFEKFDKFKKDYDREHRTST